jgi:hypothetical protein
VAGSIDENALSDDIVSRTRKFLRDSVGYHANDSYFLLPIFRFMRPTALQVIRQGGDCADRARAFIVILNLFDIRARKLALYDARGHSVHAVAKVWTDRGPYYIDLFYNLAYEDAGGGPLSLAELTNEGILRSSIERAVSAGNAQAASYPIEEYNFGNVRTLNWEKSLVTQVVYRVLVKTLGENRVKTLPRPYVSEEPALMVIVLATGASISILMAMVVIRGRKQDCLILAPQTARLPSALTGTLQTAGMNLEKPGSFICADEAIEAIAEIMSDLKTQPGCDVRRPVRLPLGFSFSKSTWFAPASAQAARIPPDYRDPDTLSPDLESLERAPR